MSFDRSMPPVIFGEALFDCFPDGAKVLGGAPFNVAWHLSAFGAAPVFISRVGEDDLGDRIGQAMSAQRMTQVGLQRDPLHGTGSVQVSLVDGEPSYDIVFDRAYDHIDSGALPRLPAGALLYHGSLALRHGISAKALGALREALDPAVFVDVNLRDPWWDKTTVRGMIEAARWVKLNADELAMLAPAVDDRAGDPIETRALALLQRHGLELVVTTLGAAGSLALGADGTVCRVAPQGSVQVVDAVGAGDGFASVLILGLLHDWPLQQTLERAQAFASAIVGQRGATVRDPEFYASFARSWQL